MNRRDFLKGLGAAGAVGAAGAGIAVAKEEPHPKHPSQPAEAFKPPLLRPTQVTSSYESPVQVYGCSYEATFHLDDDVHVGDVVEINEAGTIQRCRKGSVPVGTVTRIRHDRNAETGQKVVCDIAMHGWLGYTCTTSEG